MNPELKPKSKNVRFVFVLMCETHQEEKEGSHKSNTVCGILGRQFGVLLCWHLCFLPFLALALILGLQNVKGFVFSLGVPKLKGHGVTALIIDMEPQRLRRV